MDINPQNLNTIFTGFQATFKAGFGAVPSLYKRVAMTVPSTTREETYAWLGQFPKMREWIGDRIVKNLALHGYKIVNKDFELTQSVPVNDIEDDTYGVFSPMFAEMGRSCGEMPDELVFGTLKAGFASLCYDGKAFFAVDHPVGNGENAPAAVSNFQDGAGEPWFLLDTTKFIKPIIWQERRAFGNLVRKDRPEDDNVFWKKEYVYGGTGRANVGFGLWQLAYASKADLTAENYEAARAAMASLKGDEGRALNIKPDVLVCGPTLEGDAMRLLNNGSRIVLANNGTDDVPVAISNEWAKTAEPIVTAWLA